jgi:hypothetical protein
VTSLPAARMPQLDDTVANEGTTFMQQHGLPASRTSGTHHVIDANGSTSRTIATAGSFFVERTCSAVSHTHDDYFDFFLMIARWFRPFLS